MKCQQQRNDWFWFSSVHHLPFFFLILSLWFQSGYSTSFSLSPQLDLRKLHESRCHWWLTTSFRSHAIEEIRISSRFVFPNLNENSNENDYKNSIKQTKPDPDNQSWNKCDIFLFALHMEIMCLVASTWVNISHEFNVIRRLFLQSFRFSWNRE